MTPVFVLFLSLSTPAAQAAEWRELYTNEARATSFLRSSWNQYQENYHPNYAFDDDPATGWVEGAEGDGIGSAIEWPVTALRQASELKLKIRDGYQKSAALFAANAVPKDIAVSVLDSRGAVVATGKYTLDKKMDWQEISLKLPGDRGFNTVRLEILSVYPGSKYKDTVISDIRTMVLSDVPANAAMEKARRDALLAWKKERLADAAWFAKAPTTWPWAATSFTDESPDITPQAVDKALAPSRVALARVSKLSPQYRVTPKAKSPLPDGVWLDNEVSPLLRTSDYALFEATNNQGKTVKETYDAGDGEVSDEVLFQRTSSNASVEWADATQTRPAALSVSYKQDSWSREATTSTGSFLLQYDAQGQLSSLYATNRMLDEGACWLFEESLTSFSWTGGKITRIDEQSRRQPESCQDPNMKSDYETTAWRTVRIPQ